MPRTKLAERFDEMEDHGKPILVQKGAEDTAFFNGMSEADAFDLLYSAMYQETIRLRSCWSAKKKKASQEFILECFRALTEDRGKAPPAHRHCGDG